ncbi:hypothetical protein [Streptomyces sp. NPDC059757]|uniref:hypothetical protein n=1 Tax=Streptomyces sp. NPDC059757 TaxID=3346935 RepID=UPI00364EA91D
MFFLTQHAVPEVIDKESPPLMRRLHRLRATGVGRLSHVARDGQRLGAVGRKSEIGGSQERK